MSIFADKLRRLPETIRLIDDASIQALSSALRAGSERTILAIGSGGSAVAAEYFARCRSTLGFGVTVVMTPMEFVLTGRKAADSEIWLFSAGADNPDIAAAFRSASQSGAAAIRLVTVGATGATTLAAIELPRCSVFVLPVADPKDGFIATHSMTAMITALLLACDKVCEQPSAGSLINAFDKAASEALAPDRTAADATVGFQAGDTILLLCDPRVRPIAVLIETSLWETGIAPVQLTDFRNFAHGRHVWAAKYPDKMFTLALTAAESREVWRPIAQALPQDLRGGKLDFGGAGRFRCAVGVLEGLRVIESLGNITNIDPAKPGCGDFARAIYADPSLDGLSSELLGAKRQKLEAREFHDPLEEQDACICATARDRMEKFRQARFQGIVLDYDGTIVSTQARLEAPDPALIDELVRLVDGGMILGIATGRGGSVGQMLRATLPNRLHNLVTVGYYNGGHVRSLEVNIEDDQPPQDANILAVAEWIEAQGLLPDGQFVKKGKVQIALDHAALLNPKNFVDRMRACPAVADGTVKILSSHHSFDLVPTSSSKLAVVDAVAAHAGGLVQKNILRVGDSGSPLGNDHELLTGQFGVSVDSVCGSLGGSWTLFGSDLKGPSALFTLLQAMTIKDSYGILDMELIGSTNGNINGTE